jgi:(p)ppGpp synthase/HD superfamily hydrolase
VIIAGLLHDVIEDTGCEPVKMEKEFGENVTRIVQEVTFDQSIPWREKQGVMQKRMVGASPEAKAVKIADVIHHLITLIGFIDDKKGPELLIRRSKHSAAEYVWKYGGLIKAISQNWQHPILKEAQELFETFKNKTKPDEKKVSHE